jgi:hypothetical protein
MTDTPTETPAPTTVLAEVHLVLLGTPEDESTLLCETRTAERAVAITRALNRLLRSPEYAELAATGQSAWTLSGVVVVPVDQLGERRPVPHVVATDGTVLGRLVDGKIVQDAEPAPEPAPVEEEPEGDTPDQEITDDGAAQSDR